MSDSLDKENAQGNPIGRSLGAGGLRKHPEAGIAGRAPEMVRLQPSDAEKLKLISAFREA